MRRYLVRMHDWAVAGFRGGDAYFSIFDFCCKSCMDDDGVIHVQGVVEMFYYVHAEADFDLHCIMRDLARIRF